MVMIADVKVDIYCECNYGQEITDCGYNYNWEVMIPRISKNITPGQCQATGKSRFSGSHFSALTKFQDFSRILYKIPGIIFFFLNVASTYNWVSVYTLHITSTMFCLHYPKVCIPPLTATHNDLYCFVRWVLIKIKNRN